MWSRPILTALAALALLLTGCTRLSAPTSRSQTTPAPLVRSSVPTSPTVSGAVSTPASRSRSPSPGVSTPTALSQLFPTDISFVDALHGWFLGSSTINAGIVQLELRFTDDGGVSWQVLPPPPISWTADPPSSESHDVRHIYFATALDGWLYGCGLYATHDGGNTWIDEQPAGDVRQLVAADGTIWELEQQCTGAIPDPFSLRSSSDMGRTWQPLPAQPNVTPAGGPLLRPGKRQAWLFGYGVAALTDDAGASWQTVALPATPSCGTATLSVGRIFAANNGGRLWLLCPWQPGAGMQRRQLYLSDDDGQHWMEVPNQPAHGYPNVLVVTTPERAFVGLQRGNLIRSDDGGATWQSATPLTEGFYQAVAFVDPVHGWALARDYAGAFGGYEPVVWRTTDGGATWNRIVVH